MRNLLSLIVASFVAIDSSSAWKQFIDFGSCSQLYYVNKDHTYQMSWTGSSIFSPCRVSFQGYDPDRPEDKYKTCIKATTWNVKNSDIKLQYYSGSGFLFNYLDKTYTMYSGSPSVQWCSGSDDYVDVKLATSQSFSSQGKIILSVTAVRTSTYYYYGGTVGGAVAGVIAIVVVVIIVSIICRRRAYARRTTTVAYPATTPNTTIITQSGSQQMTGGTANPGFNTAPVAPPVYYPPNNQYPGPSQNYPAQSPPYPPPYPGQQKY